MQSGQLNFTIDSSLLFQLGEQLVAKPSIALAELIKNAYDADATSVTVSLEKIGETGGTILVEDNGHGMTFEEIESGWMRIATGAKRDSTTSRVYCRPYTGAKGIGRFAARRLGSGLILQSVANYRGNKEITVVHFDWNAFSSGSELSKVPVRYERREVSRDTPTGVSLYISNTRDAWSEDEINELRSDLLSLQSPFPDLIQETGRESTDECQSDPGFDLKFAITDSNSLEQLSGGLGQIFLNLAVAELNGWIDSEGQAHYAIEFLRNGDKDEFVDRENKYGSLIDARFRVYYFVYRSELVKGTGFSLRDLQRRGREEGGIRLYLSGFRVFPYGDPGDDWLQLDYYAARNIDMASDILLPSTVTALAQTMEKQRPFLLIPRNQQVFGAVFTSQDRHTGIEPTINRERLIETPTFIQLRNFVQSGIYWLTMKYAASTFESRTERKKQRESKTAVRLISEARDSISRIQAETEVALDSRGRIENPDTVSKSMQNTLDEATGKLDEALVAIELEQQEHISDIAMLRLLASAGTLLIQMNHQLQAVITGILQIREDLIRLRSSIPTSLYPAFDDVTNQISEWHYLVELQVSQLGTLVSPDSRQIRKRLPLREIVDNVTKPLTYYMNLYGVTFENKVVNGLRTPPIYQAEIYAVLINLFSNALKAVTTQPTRRIAVEASKLDNKLYIRMMDTGIGLPKERWESSFKPFETTSLPNPFLGIGTGLGLTVVRDILSAYDANAYFIEANLPWVTCIEVILPDKD